MKSRFNKEARAHSIEKPKPTLIKYKPDTIVLPPFQNVVIGIHFGLEYIRVGMYINDTFHIIPDENNKTKWVNWISFGETVVVGEEAKKRAGDKKWTTIRMKSVLPNSTAGSIQKILVNGVEESFFIEELIAIILAKAKAYAEAFISHQVVITHCVIAVPSMFNHIQRLSVYNAAQLANLTVMQMVSEVSAVAVCYHSEVLRGIRRGDFPEENIYIIYKNDVMDYDAAVIHVSRSGIQMKSISGEPYKHCYPASFFQMLRFGPSPTIQTNILKDAIRCSEILVRGTEKTLFVGDFVQDNLGDAVKNIYRGVSYSKSVVQGVSRLAQNLSHSAYKNVDVKEVCPHSINGYGINKRFNIFKRNTPNTFSEIRTFQSFENPILAFYVGYGRNRDALLSEYSITPPSQASWSVYWTFLMDSMGILHVQAYYRYPNVEPKEDAIVFVSDPRNLSAATMNQLKLNVERYINLKPCTVRTR